MIAAAALRSLVRRRADEACEYCRLPETASALSHQVDHIIATQHGGSDDDGNLCFCCIRCNLKKGPNIASLDPVDGALVPLSHPRSQRWLDHSAIAASGRLHGETGCGRATVALLGMNDAERLDLRRALLRTGRMKATLPGERSP